MMILHIAFWGALACVIYTYVIYPAVMAVAARAKRLRQVKLQQPPRSLSIVITAYNEQQTIGRRIREFTRALVGMNIAGEVIVVSDGSTDRTVEIARECADACVRIIDLPVNRGKACALNQGCAAARHEIIVFADARQTWGPDALANLLERYRDPSVGAVGGELVVESAPGVMAGVGLYWRYEKWLRRQESTVHSTVGVSGAICSVRRELFREIPPGTILDDMYWPLRVAMAGRRVVHESVAVAFDRLPERVGDEFKRKVRTLSGNYQLFMRLPAALMPWRNPIWFQVISHKLMRLLVPWALLTLLILGALLPGPVYRAALWCQLFAYVLALAGVKLPMASRVRAASAAGSFLVLNTAAWLAFWVWISGRAGRSWRKVAYHAPGSRA